MMVIMTAWKDIVTKILLKESKKFQLEARKELSALKSKVSFNVIEIEECYRKRIIKFNETLMGFVMAKVDRHEGSFEIESFPPEDIVHYMSESPWSIDSGFCYTLRLNELKNEIPMFFLHPNLSYFYVLHDYNYYFHSTNPLMYPRILKNVHMQNYEKKVLF